MERRRQPVREAAQRELAVARLAARVLRDGDHARAAARPDALLLCGCERSEAATSKTASMRDAVTLACWPPGPDERLARSSISDSGIRTERVMTSGSETGIATSSQRTRPPAVSTCTRGPVLRHVLSLETGGPARVQATQERAPSPLLRQAGASTTRMPSGSSRARSSAAPGTVIRTSSRPGSSGGPSGAPRDCQVFSPTWW